MHWENMDYRKYSRLPDAPEYWEALAERIEATREDGRGWLRAASLVALLSAAATAAVFLATPTPAPPSNLLADALAPRDPVAALFTSYNEVRP
jgi:hypothetical protein